MKLTGIITERIVYIINALFVIGTIAVSSKRIQQSGEKEIYIYFGWLLLGIYFASLSLTFYESNIKNAKNLSRTFKIISLIPMLYLVPVTIGHGITLFNYIDWFSLTIAFGGTIWIAATLLNILMKVKNTSNKV